MARRRGENPCAVASSAFFPEHRGQPPALPQLGGVAIGREVAARARDELGEEERPDTADLLHPRPDRKCLDETLSLAVEGLAVLPEPDHRLAQLQGGEVGRERFGGVMSSLARGVTWALAHDPPNGFDLVVQPQLGLLELVALAHEHDEVGEGLSVGKSSLVGTTILAGSESPRRGGTL